MNPEQVLRDRVQILGERLGLVTAVDRLTSEYICNRFRDLSLPVPAEANWQDVQTDVLLVDFAKAALVTSLAERMKGLWYKDMELSG